eukprot:3068495-Prymnesium_polylepis.1
MDPGRLHFRRAPRRLLSVCARSRARHPKRALPGGRKPEASAASAAGAAARAVRGPIDDEWPGREPCTCTPGIPVVHGRGHVS